VVLTGSLDRTEFMPRTTSRLALILASALVAVLGPLSSRASAAPLLTGFLDEKDVYLGPNGGQVMRNAKAAGASTIRILVYWKNVAPTSPDGSFVSTDPGDPQYDWTEVDEQVRLVKSHGLQPILDFALAPAWASGSHSGIRAGAYQPDPAKFGQFARAAAKRYDGSFPIPGGALRVKYWQAWNEPNYPWFLAPQYDSSGKPVGAQLYRRLVNAFAASVHAVHSDNSVTAGGTAPRGGKNWSPPHSPPKAFVRNVLCLSSTKPYKAKCTGKKVQFDAWSTHPYTWGGPTTKAKKSDWLYLSDLPWLRKLLNAATNLHRVVNASGHAKKRVDLWVTEFSWDSKAPDPKAVPSKLHQRWTSESLYRMWMAGVRMLTWFTIRDRPLPESFWQSGFWYCGHATTADDPNSPLCGLDPANDVRKPSFRAFRFPFVAFAKNGKVSVWGMVPRGAPRKVAIQRSKKRGGGYRTVKSFKVGSGGIFKWRQSTSWTAGFYRAKISGEASVPFSLRRPKAYALKQPFGCGGGVSCN
jgi:hypothetical protein